MSVQRGLFLRRLIAVLPVKTFHSRTITLLLLIACVLGVGAVSTDLILSGLAARRARAEKNINSIPTPNTKLRRMTSRGPLAAAGACAAPFAAFQGCTVSCNATVPGTGTVGAAVSFQATATASGCSSQPAYSWDFGDGGISAQQNPTHSYVAAGTYNWTLTTSASSGGLTIDTIAGGLGEGVSTRQASFGTIGAIARDPLNRGVYIADVTRDATLIRFINTSGSPVTLGVRTIAPGTVRSIAGGGGDFTTDNISAFQANVGDVSGLAVSPGGDLVYYNDRVGGVVRAVNVSTGAVNIRGQSTSAGNVRTLASSADFPQFPDKFLDLFGLTTTSSGDVYVIDSSVNKVYKITSAGVVTAFAGNGMSTVSGDPFPAGTPAATNVPLLQPRAVKSDGATILIADTGHRRVIRVSGGTASLVRQFDAINTIGNPYPSGIAVQGCYVFAANGNEKAIYQADNAGPKIAGITLNGDPTFCDYSSNNCGDGGPAINAGLNLLGGSDEPPLAGLDSDGNGLFVADQKSKGRVRYINRSGGTVTLAGVQIPAGAIDTIAGTGLNPPYDGRLATAAQLTAPTGVAVDGNGNLWIADTTDDRLRFVNQSANQVTIFAGTPAQQNVDAGAIVTVNKDSSGSGDNLPVNQITLDKPQGLFVTGQGIYVVDSLAGPLVPARTGNASSLIRFINTTSAPVTIYPGAGPDAITVQPGNIRTIAGGGISDLTSGLATAVTLKGASDIAVTGNGTIYVTEVFRKAVRKIDGSTGIVSALTFPSGQKEYTGLGFTTDGRLLVANFTDGAVLRESTPGSGSFANFGVPGGNLANVRDVVGGPNGIAYAITGTPPAQPGVPTGNHRVVLIASTGSNSVVAGGSPGFDGDGGAASGGRLNTAPPRLVLSAISNATAPETVNITLGLNGEIIFTDTNNNRVRSISGTISTCTKTGTVTINGPNPIPVLTSIDPTSRLNGSGAFMLRAIGDKFAPNSVVRLDGTDRPTNFGSATQLTASIPASDLLTGGMAKSVQVTVFTPPSATGGGGGTSAATTFTIIGNNPVPTISSINPTEKREGDPGFTMTVIGTGFINGASVVRFEGTPRLTTFVNPTMLTAQIDATDLIGQGTVNITVFNPAPAGGTSNAATFTVRPAQADVPVLTSISPNTIAAGSAAFTITANGSKFTSNSVVRWNGQAGNVELMTAFGSATQLTAQVPANLVASQGTAQVTVFTPAPGGGTSGAQTFTIGPGGPNPTPSITVLNPPAVGIGQPDFNLIINGTGFIGASQAQINGVNRTTTSVSSTKLSVAVLAADIPNAAGNVQVKVINPPSGSGGGGTSNTVNLRVVPTFTTVSAASFANPSALTADSIGAGFGLGIGNGTSFATNLPLPTNLNGTEVKVTDSMGTERQAGLFFVSGPANQINYHVPSGTAIGVATAVVTLNGNIVAAGPVNVVSLAPALFAFRAVGKGVVAGVALWVQGAAQKFDIIYDLQNGTFVPKPIDLGPDTDIVYLIAFGTGMRNNSGPAGITVDFGNGMTKTLRADFSEGCFASPDLIGVDQCNIYMPRTLVGAGLLNMKLTIDNKATNTVQIAVK